MKQIPLIHNKFALVDDEDFDLISKYRWVILKSGYAINSTYIRGSGRKNQKQLQIFMHKLIMNQQKGIIVDHINGNKLDNRKENLRIATKTQNNYNKTKTPNSSSIYKGVYWDKKYKFWASEITVNYKKYFIGYFNNELHAGMAYDIWARECQEDFAKLNFKSI